jgi:DNA adenine methylase
MSSRLPHPIPYQGSKRALAPLIGAHVPRGIDVWFEPFAGSAAMTLWAIHNRVARRYVIADVLEPIARLWQAIIDKPDATAERYRLVWDGQHDGDTDYFNRVRARYNASHDPVDLLYLICRCVKNAVRFNASGQFTQSVDRRRLGMQPDRMAAAIATAALMLKGLTEVRSGDWLATTADAGARDFIYLDPPYLGTTVGRDKRYTRQLESETLIAGLESLLRRRARFALSYDGMTGERTYGPPLPAALGLSRLLLDAGTSSQATLLGRAEKTVESLYLSPGLLRSRSELRPIASAPR